MDDIIAKAGEVAAAMDEVEKKVADIGFTAEAMAGLVNAAADSAAKGIEGIGEAADKAAAVINASSAADAAALGIVEDAANDVAGARGDAGPKAARLAGSLFVAAGSSLALAGGMGAAGDKTGRTYRWLNLSSNAIHWIISGTAELLAVLLPATVAAGAWAAVWLQGTTNVYQHIMSVYGATEAMANAGAETAGQMLGLGHALQTAQNAANPDVYQALGGAINLVRESAGGLATVGLEVGKIFDTFMAKVVYDFSAAGQAGQTMGQLLHAMIPDLVEIGQVFGNIGAALASFASQMPGLAEVLLGLLAGLTDVLKVVIEVAGEFRIFGVSVLTVGMAIEEFNRWGSLLVGLFGRMGLASTKLSGGLGSYFITGGRFIGILKNMIAVLPMAGFAIASLASKIPVLGAALVGSTADVEASRAAFAEWVGELSAAETLGIVGAAAGLGVLTYWLVSSKSATQEFTDSLQKAALAASNLDVLSVIGQNMGKIQAATNQATQALNGLNDAGKESASSAGTVASSWKGAAGALASARETSAQLSAGMVQQVSDAGTVVTGANAIAKAYGLTVPEAMMLATQAGVSLTGAVVNQKGQWTALGEKVREAVSGYAAMGQSSGALGNDMLALAIQTGLAGTKVSALNQAWDSFMGNLTGGTSALAGMVESMKNIGTGVASVKENPAESTSAINASTSKFANDLTTMGTKGAAAWQNFDQVVGETGPQVADWLRTAAAEGALGAHAFGTLNQAALDLVSGLVPLASKSKAAQAEVLGLAQDAGFTGTTFKQLKDDTDKTHASLGGLTRIIDGATVKMGNMASVAQQLGDVMNNQVASAISNAALQATGFNTDASNLTEALAHNGNYGGHTATYWAERTSAAYREAGNDAATATGKIAASTSRQVADAHRQASAWDSALAQARAYQRFLDSMHGVNIRNEIDTNYYTSGAAAPGAPPTAGGSHIRNGAAGGLVTGPGTSTSDSIGARLSDGEYVVNAAAVAHYGRAVFDAMNARRMASGGIVSPSPGAAPALVQAAASGGAPIHMSVNLKSAIMLDSQRVGTAQRTESLTFNPRNPTNYLSLTRR